MKPRVVILGLGGLSSSLICPWIQRGWLPNLEFLIRRGISGPIDSPVPPFAAPEWAAILTGRNPGRTGHLDHLSKRPGSYFPERTHLTSLCSDGIWTQNSWGIRTALVNVPNAGAIPMMNETMVGPHRVMINESESLSEFRRAITAQRRMFRDFLEETGLKAISFLKRVTGETIQEGNILGELVKMTSLDLVVGHFSGPDRLLPRFWKEIEEILEEGIDTVNSDLKTAIILYFKVLDDAIGKILESLNPKDLIILVSGHGFGPLRKLVNVNGYLGEKGHLSFRGKSSKDNMLCRFVAPTLRKVGIRRSLARKFLNRYGGGSLERLLDRVALPFSADVGLFDWSRTRAFALSRSGVHLNVRGLDPLGTVQPGREARETGDVIIQDLLSLSDPETGERIFYDIQWRDHLYDGPRLGELPHLILRSWNPSFQVADLYQANTQESIFIEPEDRTGTHRKDGFFILAGGNFFRSEFKNPLSLLDIAPLVLSFFQNTVPTP